MTFVLPPKGEYFRNNDVSSKYLMTLMPHKSSSQILMGKGREIKTITMEAEGLHLGLLQAII